MFDALLRILRGFDDNETVAPSDDPAFALAVLLIETALIDDGIGGREKEIIKRALERRFRLKPDEVARLVEAAEEGALRSTDLYRFTQIVIKNFDEEERVGVIEMLWEVALADGTLTGDADMLIRRVAGLIYVSDRDRGEAKRRAIRRGG
jgi:uncharacterized tellurite resistance protein B-like protein